MKFSTRAEYGLKAIVNLAQIYPRQKNLKTVSREEQIPSKYLERLVGDLRKKQLVVSSKGKAGGYALAKNPAKIRVGEIIEILEGPIAPMRCSGGYCALKQKCSSSFVWNKLGKQIKKTLYGIKLKDLIK